MSRELTQIRDEWSGPRKFYEMVRLMRQSQKIYFETRTTAALEQAKMWEREVARVIEQTERNKAEKREPRLNFD